MTLTAELIADWLMGAAYADQTFDGRERATVRELLEAWLAAEELPPALEPTAWADAARHEDATSSDTPGTLTG